MSNAQPEYQSLNRHLGLVVGSIITIVILASVLLLPNVSDRQYEFLRIIISLGAAGISGVFTGYMHIKGTIFKWVFRGGGPLAVFIVVYFFSPASVGTDIAQECHGESCQMIQTNNGVININSD